ncbi:Hint domain-containing protein [Profundibacter sp.]
MPTGYLVTLGDMSLNAGDSVIDPATGFTTTVAIGSGTVTWTGTTPGFWPWSPPANHTNEVAAGQYHEATDGNVYFVPDAGTNATITSASVTTAPAYSSGDGVLTGTAGDDVIDASFVDEDGEQVDAGDGTGPSGNEDLIRAGDGNDTIASGAGDDTVYGGAGSDTIDGGAGNDVIYGDTGPGGAESLNWDNEGGDGSNIAAGFTQDTGEMDVTVAFSDDGNNNATFNVETTDVNYVVADEPYNTTSSVRLFGNGDAATSTTTIDFATSAGSSASDDVQNVQFRISDIDWASGDFRDQVTIRAYDANGNGVHVNITESSNDTLSGNTITGGDVAEGTADEGGSALIEIAGPVSSITVAYGNMGTGTQAIRITDVHFDTIVDTSDGNDTIDGGAGDDIIYGQDGDDTIAGGLGLDEMSGGDGNDTIEVAQDDSAYGGDGDDTFNVVDLAESGSGSINIVGGEGGETDGDTLNWAGVADKDSLVITNSDDADGGLSGSFTMLDGTVVTFSEIENIVCFASTTGILIPHGTRPIEDLKAGDFVIIRDNGLQAIRWIGKRTVPALNKFAPICFAAGSLPNLERPLLVSPQHRMLVGNHLSELYLGESEVLVSAKHMLNGTSITRKVGGEVSYMHMLFDRHEIIYADGTASESFHPGDSGLDAVSDAARSEMFSPSHRPAALRQHRPQMPAQTRSIDGGLSSGPPPICPLQGTLRQARKAAGLMSDWSMHLRSSPINLVPSIYRWPAATFEHRQ